MLQYRETDNSRARRPKRFRQTKFVMLRFSLS